MRNIMNEKLLITETNPIKARYYDYKHFTYPWHCHSQFEIAYVEKSSGTCYAGDCIEKYTDGDLILFGENLPHYLKSDDIYYKENTKLRVKGIIIQFEKNFMSYSINHYPQLLQIKEFLKASKRGVMYKRIENGEIKTLLDRIVTDTGFHQIVNLLELLQQLAIYPDKKFLASQQYQPSLPILGGNRIEKIIDYIWKNYTQNISLEDMADKAAMNRSAFCRYFKKQTGKSFVRFVNDIRVGYARKLLMDNDMDIAQIAFDSGFESVNHFNRTFKSITSYTPTEFRYNMLK